MPLFEIAEPLYKVGGPPPGGGVKPAVSSAPKTTSGGGGGGGGSTASKSTGNAPASNSTPKTSSPSPAPTPGSSTGKSAAPSADGGSKSAAGTSSSTGTSGSTGTESNAASGKVLSSRVEGNNTITETQGGNGAKNTVTQTKWDNGTTRSTTETANANGSSKTVTETKWTNGTSETVTRDTNGLTTREVTFPSGGTLKTTEAANGAKTTVQKLADGGQRTTVETRLADGASAAMKTEKLADGTTQTSITLTRGGNQPSTVITKNADGTFSFTTQAPNGQTLANPAGTSFKFDAQGVVTKVNPSGTTLINTKTGALTLQVNENTVATRNADMSVTTRTTENGVTKAVTRDVNGNVIDTRDADAAGNVVTKTQIPDPRDPSKTVTRVQTIGVDGSISAQIEGRIQSMQTQNPDGSVTLGPKQLEGVASLASSIFRSNISTTITVPPQGLPLNAEVLGGKQLFSEALNGAIQRGDAPNPFTGVNKASVNGVANFLEQTGLNINAQFPSALAFGAVARGVGEPLQVPSVQQGIMQQFNNTYFGGPLGIVNNIVHNAGNNNPSMVINKGIRNGQINTGSIASGIFQNANASFQQAGLPSGPFQRPAVVTPISGAQLNQFINASNGLNLSQSSGSPFRMGITQLTPGDLRSVANGQIPTSPDVRLIPSFLR